MVPGCVPWVHKQNVEVIVEHPYSKLLEYWYELLRQIPDVWKANTRVYSSWRCWRSVLNIHSWHPFVRRIDFTCPISAFLSSSLLMILFALFMSISTTDYLHCRWWFNPKFRYCPMCELLFGIPWPRSPHSPPRCTCVSQKDSLPPFSSSIVKFDVGI